MANVYLLYKVNSDKFGYTIKDLKQLAIHHNVSLKTIMNHTRILKTK